MDNNFQKAASELMASERLSEKKSELQNIASSDDGEEVRKMLERGGFEKAVKEGDAAAVKNALSGVLRTDAGARLIKQLQELMNGK